MRVTLTFDNGPTPGITDAVLDELRARGITAWFFVIGERLRAARHLVERARSDGHLIGNHTWSHFIPLGERDARSAVDEIALCERELGALACPAPVLRPFGRGGEIGGHLIGPAAGEYLRVNLYTVVLWNNVPGDWRDPAGWVDRAIEMARREEHSVIVLHDIDDGCADRLAELLDRLAALDAEFTTDLPASCLPMVHGQTTPAFGAIDWRTTAELV